MIERLLPPGASIEPEVMAVLAAAGIAGFLRLRHLRGPPGLTAGRIPGRPSGPDRSRWCQNTEG
jgi:hypothetical protein